MNSNPQVEQATAGLKFSKCEIVTDGTAKGTSIKINGKEIDDLSSLSFYWYGGMYCPLSLSYTVREKSKAGELHANTTYSLRCPDPEGAYATKAEASVAPEPQLYFEFAQHDNDPVAEQIEAHRVVKRSNMWAQL